MKTLNRQNVQANLYPERIIQFGEGNFLRAFIGWFVKEMNEKANFNTGMVVVQPIEQGMVNMLNDQDGLYTLVLKGLANGKPVRTVQLLDVINRGINPYTDFKEYLALAENPEMRFVVSNTTEAGIACSDDDKLDDAPAKSYPAKLTQLLFHRFNHFQGAADKGMIIIPCELINYNGQKLQECVMQTVSKWNLSNEFKTWIEKNCHFCTTLVDRIVPGYPRETIQEVLDEVQYEDKLVVEAEIFHLFVIEAPKEIQHELPFEKAGLNALFVPSIQPYRDRKVTLLNGPHTVLSPVAYLAGLNLVREACEDDLVGKYIHQVMYNELIPSLDLPQAELEAFANDVMDRFKNPFVKHQVTSIMLNSYPKFKTRDLPSIKIYLERKGTLPPALVFGLAAITVYYKGGKRGADQIVPNDDAEIMELLTSLWKTGDIAQITKGVLGAQFIWGEDLNAIKGMTETVQQNIEWIESLGMTEAIKKVI